VLYERRPGLGGRARLAGLRKGRERWALYIDWLRAEAEGAGAELRTGVDATAQHVLADAPDAVILATGSRLRSTAAIPGPVLVVDVDVLLEHGPPEVRTRSALVLDDEGGFLAPSAAERLVAEGFSVEIATTHPVVGAEIDPTQQPFVFQGLELAGVVMTPHLGGVASDGDGVILRNIYTERDERRDGVGLVVVAGYRHGVVELRNQLRALEPELHVVVVGDALSPRTLLDAVSEGARAGAEVTVKRAVRAGLLA
jgi:dimethylglycine catabolism A